MFSRVKLAINAGWGVKFALVLAALVAAPLQPPVYAKTGETNSHSLRQSAPYQSWLAQINQDPQQRQQQLFRQQQLMHQQQLQDFRLQQQQQQQQIRWQQQQQQQQQQQLRLEQQQQRQLLENYRRQQENR